MNTCTHDHMATIWWCWLIMSTYTQASLCFYSGSLYLCIQSTLHVDYTYCLWDLPHWYSYLLCAMTLHNHNASLQTEVVCQVGTTNTAWHIPPTLCTGHHAWKQLMMVMYTIDTIYNKDYQTIIHKKLHCENYQVCKHRYTWS